MRINNWLLAASAVVPIVGFPSISVAMGNAPLSASSLSSLQTSLTDALHAAKGDANAINMAIAQVTQTAVAENGVDTAGSIASAVIATAELRGASSAEIGTGLGRVSVAFAPPACEGNGGNALNDCRIAAAAVAEVFANEGKTDEILAYQATVIALHFPKLAEIAGKGATPTSEIGPGVAVTGFGGGGFSGGGPGGGGGCANPSCTKL